MTHTPFSEAAASMYGLSVGSIFKNEEHAIVEWVEHYLRRGVEHFYLIDDGSTDTSVALLQPYIDANQVTLFQPAWARYLGRQRAMYTQFFLPVLKDSKWFLIVDMDEFAWSPLFPDLRQALSRYEHLGQIQVVTTIFGSNGHISQPSSILHGFTRRSKEIQTAAPRCYKYFINTAFEFTELNVHHALFKKKEDEEQRFQIHTDPWFRINHYSCQSREIWDKVKTTRGDCDEYLKRTDDHWRFLDQNDVEDRGILAQTPAVVDASA